MRCRYTGSEMSRSGQVIAYREPTNAYPTIPAPVAAFLANRESVTVPADRKWHAAVWRPSTPRDLAYFDDYTSFSQFAPSLFLIVSGATPATSFEVDLVGWYEVIGNNLPHLSRSHADPLGMSVVSAALSEKQPTATPVASVNSFIKDATEIAHSSISFLSAAKPVVKTALEIASLL